MSARSAAALMTALCLSMSACATAPAPYQGPSHESRALSVTNAVDLVGLRDAKLPEGAFRSLPGFYPAWLGGIGSNCTGGPLSGALAETDEFAIGVAP